MKVTKENLNLEVGLKKDWLLTILDYSHIPNS